ncbi:MAG: hypothetical protein EXS13_04415 [Planctomycetes bacterium]|nr:hypothetical protein [Planctomycetota bacterium]
MPRRLTAFALLAGAFLPVGCRVTAGVDENPDRIEVDGPGVIYATADAWPRWNGNVFELGLFNEAERDGEFLSLDVWPIAGVGFGFLGVRARLLMLEVGAATFCHDPLPLPSRYGWSDEPAAEESHEHRRGESSSKRVRAD